MGTAVAGGYFLQPHGVEVPREGVQIHLARGGKYELSVDGNDQYRVRFFRGEQVLGETRLPDQPRGGLAIQLLEVPPEATEVLVELTGGDGRGSIGHLRPAP